MPGASTAAAATDRRRRPTAWRAATSRGWLRRAAPPVVTSMPRPATQQPTRRSRARSTDAVAHCSAGERDGRCRFAHQG
jgi:hypothetical protein